MKNYDDIINLPHYEPKNHPRMSISNRAAAFAPFSALAGYKEAIIETGRITDKKRELDEGEKELLNNKLHLIINNLVNNPVVAITYFISDKLKSGGSYITKEGIIKKIDLYKRIIKYDDNTQIPIDDILDIKCNFIDDKIY